LLFCCSVSWSYAGALCNETLEAQVIHAKLMHISST
jgi:hypothetical protein